MGSHEMVQNYKANHTTISFGDLELNAEFKKFQYTAKTGMKLYDCKKVSKFGAIINNNICYIDPSEQVFLN